MNRYLLRLLQYFNLNAEIDDYDRIHESIERDMLFRGTNLWILIFAIIVASVGLNINSTAVVIGAMLISPLMGPINGMGYGVATYNFPLFRKAVKNFNFAVVAGLAASTLYFAVSPISTAYSELLARTSPTIYDVVIALFGGLAGIVAISSKQKGNVIPGVAIATALMPPLCTAGYGLATAQFQYFFGALYLFTINTVFIAISSVAVSHILKFPIRTVVDDARRARVTRWITFVIFITIVPSVYFGYLLVQKEKFIGNATRYVENVTTFEGNFLLRNEIAPGDRRITLIYGGKSFTEEQEEHIRDIANNYRLEDCEITIRHGLSFDTIDEKLSQAESLTAEVQRLTSQLDLIQSQQDSLINKPLLGKAIYDEIKPLYPQIVSCAYSETTVFSDSSATSEQMPVIIFGLDGAPPHDSLKLRIHNWLKARLMADSIQVYYQ